MFVQNIIKLSVATLNAWLRAIVLAERKKNSDENNTVCRYRADSNTNEKL